MLKFHPKDKVLDCAYIISAGLLHLLEEKKEKEKEQETKLKKIVKEAEKPLSLHPNNCNIKRVYEKTKKNLEDIHAKIEEEYRCPNQESQVNYEK